MTWRMGGGRRLAKAARLTSFCLVPSKGSFAPKLGNLTHQGWDIELGEGLKTVYWRTAEGNFGGRMARRIGILGGSFNPAHRGHLDLSLAAIHRLGLDQVWWLVSPQNPLKAMD